ncbi:hypothetical protein LCGC14_1006910 [marine sediment metagenome]|uniref:Uncharacterized protein n=1 Tax=marine sediment metagenome TaxID=412755 RepID=A0A0F9NMV6_9ZZZZ
MIANNFDNSDILGGVVKKCSSGTVVIINDTDSIIVDEEEHNNVVVEYILNYTHDTEQILEKIEKTALAMKKFGAVTHRTYSQYFGKYMLSIKHWTPIPVFMCVSNIPCNLNNKQFYAGAPPTNRGRHFNRKVHWRRK